MYGQHRNTVAQHCASVWVYWRASPIKLALDLDYHKLHLATVLPSYYNDDKRCGGRFWMYTTCAKPRRDHFLIYVANNFREPMLVWCWTSVCDAGPTSNQHRLSVPCLLGTAHSGIGNKLEFLEMILSIQSISIRSRESNSYLLGTNNLRSIQHSSDS